MTIRKRFLRVTNILFIIFLLIQWIPDKLAADTYTSYTIWFAAGVEVLVLLVSAFAKKS